jgi:hypothetical protein
MKEIIIKDVPILLHEDCSEKSALVKKLETLSCMNLSYISRWQKEPRHYPESNAGCEDYCLYLGSTVEKYEVNGMEREEKLDLWHYPYYCNDFNRYSTGIICGNEAGNYKSGWPSLALKHESYKKLLRREVVCGLIDDPAIIVELGLAVLDLRPDMSEVTYNPAINEAGGGRDSDDDGDFFDYHEADWWTKHWIFDELNRKGI